MEKARLRSLILALPLSLLLSGCGPSMGESARFSSATRLTQSPPTGTEAPLSSSPIAEIGGPMVSVSAVEALGGVFLKYEQDFRTYIEQHWTADGAGWAASNYYDRAKIYYIWYERTGNAAYLERAHALALDYRINYLEANNYGSSAHWAMMAGLAIHYRLTGDQESRRAIGALADGFALPYYLNNLGDVNAQMDNRIQARVLNSFLYAWQIGAPSLGVPNIQPDGSDWGTPGSNDWASLLRDALNKILSSQSADGAYRWVGQCGYNKPFMVGLLNDALIEYYEKFDKDPRILSAIKKSLDYMWAKNWRSDKAIFDYLDADCAVHGETSEGSADLNNMMLPGFGFVYQHTKDVTYKQRGDEILAGGVNGAWIQGGKQFNQSYTNSYKYFFYRQ